MLDSGDVFAERSMESGREKEILLFRITLNLATLNAALSTNELPNCLPEIVQSPILEKVTFVPLI